MLEGLFWSEPLFDFPFEALVNEVDEEVVFAFHHFCELFAVGHSNSSLGVWVLQWSVVIVEEDLSSRS